MIEERARVLSIESDAVWVETIRQSACGSCQARTGCGQSLLQRLGGGRRQGFIRALNTRVCAVGDEVVIGIPETAVLQGSALVYLLPLLGLFLFALLAQAAGLGEPAVIVAGFAGMGVGFAIVRWRTARLDTDPAFVPQVIGRALPHPERIHVMEERSEY